MSVKQVGYQHGDKPQDYEADTKRQDTKHKGFLQKVQK
jgi:hypothetical protein